MSGWPRRTFPYPTPAPSLVTGGTGSFGKKFVEIMLREYHPSGW